MKDQESLKQAREGGPVRREFEVEVGREVLKRIADCIDDAGGVVPFLLTIRQMFLVAIETKKPGLIKPEWEIIEGIIEDIELELCAAGVVWESESERREADR